MQGNSMIKVWIQDFDLSRISENNKPSKYWLTRPSYLQNIVELTLPLSQIQEWQSNSKILLKD